AGLTATLRPPAAGPAAVRWLERRGRKTPNVSLAAVPLDLAPVLKESLFDRIETVVLTSATLAAGGDFGYLEERLGLDLPPSRTKIREIHASPFDYAAQCLFGIPTDLPEPRDDESGHGAAVARLERREARGLNGFAHYLVPNAALKLKQGFGRLIRSRGDVGAVVLLDPRVVTKRYGAMILEGLPPATRLVGHWADVRGACE